MFCVPGEINIRIAYWSDRKKDFPVPFYNWKILGLTHFTFKEKLRQINVLLAKETYQNTSNQFIQITDSNVNFVVKRMHQILV